MGWGGAFERLERYQPEEGKWALSGFSGSNLPRAVFDYREPRSAECKDPAYVKVLVVLFIGLGLSLVSGITLVALHCLFCNFFFRVDVSQSDIWSLYCVGIYSKFHLLVRRGDGSFFLGSILNKTTVDLHSSLVVPKQ